jgi:hypothetical protein
VQTASASRTSLYLGLLGALGASPFEGTLIAGRGLGTVPDGTLFVVMALTVQDLALGAGIEVPLGVVDEGIPSRTGGCAFHDPLEEAAEDLQAEAFPDAGQRGVIGQRLVEVVAQIPTQREAIGDPPS